MHFIVHESTLLFSNLLFKHSVCQEALPPQHAVTMLGNMALTKKAEYSEEAVMAMLALGKKYFSYPHSPALKT